MKHRIFWLVLAICLMATIWLTSSIQYAQVSSLFLADFSLKKIWHILSFSTLVLCWYRAIDPGQHKPQFSILMSLVIVVMWAILDEIHQSWVPSRHPSVWDVILDVSSAIIALALDSIFRRSSLAQSAILDQKDH